MIHIMMLGVCRGALRQVLISNHGRQPLSRDWWPKVSHFECDLHQKLTISRVVCSGCVYVVGVCYKFCKYSLISFWDTMLTKHWLRRDTRTDRWNRVHNQPSCWGREPVRTGGVERTGNGKKQRCPSTNSMAPITAPLLIQPRSHKH